MKNKLKNMDGKLKSILKIYIILYLVLINIVSAHHIKFEHLTTEQGLSHSWVSSIYQDNQGFMWFGTFDGLNKFDGYEFITYRQNINNPNSLPANGIRSICKSKSGNLWIATMQGLCLYDREKDIFINYNQDNGYNIVDTDIWHVLEDSHGMVWIATNHNGLYQLNPNNNQIIHYAYNMYDSTGISNVDVKNIFEDSKGNLWIGTGKGLDLYNRETDIFQWILHQENKPNSIAGNRIFAITEDINGNLWFACYGDGLSTIHVDKISSLSFTNYACNPKQRNSLSSNLVLSLLPDRNGGLWIGTENSGLDFLHSDLKIFANYRNNQNDIHSLNNNSIHSLFQDRAGDLWIGTYTKGVDIIYHNKQAFEHYRNIPMKENGLSNNTVSEFCEDRDGIIWIATLGGGMNRFDPKTGQFKCYNSDNSNLNSDAVFSVFVDSKNDVWIGAWDGGLSKFDRNTKRFYTYTMDNSDLSNNNILDIDEDKDGNLWLATQGGLNNFNKKTKSFFNYNVHNSSIPTDYLEVLIVDNLNHILMGTTEGFISFNPSNESFVSYKYNPQSKNCISNNFVTSIYVENDSTVWIGTSNGLNKLDRKTNQISHYFSTDGLLNDLIFAIEKDDVGDLWISSNGGISRFNVKTKKIKNYTKDDGLQGKTFIKKSSYKSKNGMIYFGGDNGFNVFDPAKLLDNTVIPEIVITDFQIFNKPVAIGVKDSPLKKHISFTKELYLSYKNYVFSFKFTALNYMLSSKNQYAYMLDGFDPDWNYIGTSRTATYTNIDPGEYTFKVKGSNNDGYWNEKGTSIKIFIAPPFWALWWFRILILLCITGIIVAIFYSRTNRIRKYNRELEENVKIRTRELETSNKELETFAYSVSHDLRTPLRGISGFARLVQEDFEENLKDESKYYLNKIFAACRRMDDTIDNLLNLSRIFRKDIKKEYVNLSALATEIMEELIVANPDRKIEFKVQEKMYANVDVGLFYIALENLIQNAWKFTRFKSMTLIEFGYDNNSGTRKFFVRDNGSGFDMDYSNKLFTPFYRLHREDEFEGLGIGLASVKRIIEKHGGKIWAESKVKEGATFFFTLS